MKKLLAIIVSLMIGVNIGHCSLADDVLNASISINTPFGDNVIIYREQNGFVNVCVDTIDGYGSIHIPCTKFKKDGITDRYSERRRSFDSMFDNRYNIEVSSEGNMINSRGH